MEKNKKQIESTPKKYGKDRRKKIENWFYTMQVGIRNVENVQMKMLEEKITQSVYTEVTKNVR